MRRSLALFGGVTASTLAVYVPLLPPSVTAEDSGELVTAAATLGIPHPPGYPLWCLAAHPFTWLPFGTVGWRVALSSAVFGACACGVAALIAHRLTARAAAGLIAGLGLALTYHVAEQATIAEVYALNLLVLAGLLYALLRWDESAAPHWLHAAAALGGLGLATHNTFVLVGPVAALYVVLRRRTPWHHLFVAAGLAASGLLWYAYLPIRSLADPPVDWGDPETLARFWAVVSRQQYDHMLTAAPRSLERLGWQVGWFGREAFAFLWPVGLVLGAGGLLTLLRTRTSWGLMLIGTAVANVVGFSLLQNFDASPEWQHVMRVFTLPVFLTLAIGLGLCAGNIRMPGGKAATLSRLAVVAACALLLFTQLLTMPRDTSRDVMPAYAGGVLQQLEPDAYYVAQMDHAAFGTLYMQAIEGVRPDVTLVRTYGYLRPEIFRPLFDTWPAAWEPYPPQAAEPALFAALLTETERPVYFQSIPRLSPGANVRFVPQGLVWRAVRPGEPMPDAYMPDYAFCWSDAGGRTLHSYNAQLMHYEAELAQAAVALHHGAAQRGMRHIARATSTKALADEVPFLNNAGVLLARYGHYEEARHYFQRALRHAPDSEAVRRNLKRAERRI